MPRLLQLPQAVLGGLSLNVGGIPPGDSGLLMLYRISQLAFGGLNVPLQQPNCIAVAATHILFRVPLPRQPLRSLVLGVGVGVDFVVVMLPNDAPADAESKRVAVDLHNLRAGRHPRLLRRQGADGIHSLFQSSLIPAFKVIRSRSVGMAHPIAHPRRLFPAVWTHAHLVDSFTMRSSILSQCVSSLPRMRSQKCSTVSFASGSTAICTSA